MRAAGLTPRGAAKTEAPLNSAANRHAQGYIIPRLE